MFRIELSRKVKWPVEICIPLDGGKVEKRMLTVIFEIIPSDEADTALRAGALLDRVIAGMDSPLGGETGDEPLAFEGETRKNFLGIPYVRSALVEAYFQAATGREAQRKNRKHVDVSQY